MGNVASIRLLDDREASDHPDIFCKACDDYLAGMHRHSRAPEGDGYTNINDELVAQGFAEHKAY